MISRSCNPRVISSYNMDLKALLLTQGVIVATCLSTFVGARQLAPEPSASSPSPSSSSPSLCSRPFMATLWGAAFAFVSLMADAWPAAKAGASVFGDASCLRRWLNFFVFAPQAPWLGIFLLLEQMFKTIRFFQILSPRVTCPELAPDAMSLCDILKSIRIVANTYIDIFLSIRIVANTHIILGMSDPNTLPLTHIDISCSPVQEDNVADALNLGQKTPANPWLMVLNDAGKLALLESGILPKYKQLRFADGRSGIATVIIFIQAIGYVASISCRAILHFPVSPIETIGFAFSMLVIVRSVVYTVGAICENPLVIYLNPEQEQELLETCEAPRWSNGDDVCCKNAAIGGMVLVGFVVVALTTAIGLPMLIKGVKGWKVWNKERPGSAVWRKLWWENLKITWDGIGLLLFLFSLIVQLLSLIPLAKFYSPWTIPKSHSIAFFLHIPFLTFLGIFVSSVASILNWQTEFDSRTPSVIHYVPFLG